MYTWNLFVLYLGVSTLQKRTLSYQNKGRLCIHVLLIQVPISFKILIHFVSSMWRDFQRFPWNG